MARRSKRQEEVLNSLGSGEENFSTDDLDSAPVPASKRAAAKARHMSLKQLAEFLDRDRNTVMKWASSGCPYVIKGDRDAGQSWVFDLAEVVKWRERVCAEAVADKLAGGKPDEETLKLRRMQAGVLILENEAAEDVKLVARVSHVLEMIRRDHSEIIGILRGLPDAIAAKVDSKLAPKVKAIADEQVRTALTSLRADKDLERFLKE